MKIETFCRVPDIPATERWVVLVDGFIDQSIPGRMNEIGAFAAAKQKYPHETIITSLHPEHSLSDKPERRLSHGVPHVGGERRFSGIDKYIRLHKHMALDYVIERLVAKCYSADDIQQAIRRYIDRR